MTIFGLAKTVFIGVALVMLSMSVATAKAPVWKISSGENYLFLGGTIHLLSKNDYPLPKAFETAYSEAEDVWFETDAALLSSAETQVKMLNVMMYQDTRSLSTVLSRTTYDALAELMEERQLPLAAFEKFTPAGLMFTLTALELKRLGLIDETAGVDLHFEQRAKQDGKDRLHLELVDEQLAFMRRINELDPNKLIGSTLAEISNTSKTWEALLKAWRTGDMALMDKVGIAQMESEYPDIYNFLLVGRNKDWLTDLQKMIKTKEVEFVLVGALHMAGDDGLLALLAEEGYEIEQME